MSTELATIDDGGPITPRDRPPLARRLADSLQHVANSWGRLTIMAAALIVQVGLIVVVETLLSSHTDLFVLGSSALAVVVLLIIINGPMTLAYKLAWAIPILLFPVVGGVFYLLYGMRKVPARTVARWRAATNRARSAESLVPSVQVPRLPDVEVDIREEQQVRRLVNSTGYPLRQHTATRYFPVGEEAFAAMLADLEAARRYIFCEYFIVDDGEMWRRLFDVLARKAAEGLDVRFMYDDVGSLFTLPNGFRRACRDAGIRMHRVNPFAMHFTLRFNNRDHRKIMAIDGTIAYTGGLNIADEYINAKERFGHWKDTAVRLEGPGAWSLTVMFLNLWETADHQLVDYRAFVPAEVPLTENAGLVLPYDDSPFDRLATGEETYAAMLVRARRTVDIFTPYLIPTESLVQQLIATAQAGVRVRIVTPGIPDKPYVYSVTRSFYEPLVKHGVEVYEYTPGFIHAKSMCVDEEFGIVGTVNFDYRSFYLHYENAVWMCDTEAVAALAADCDATVAQSRRITLEWCRGVSWWRRLGRAVLRTFAPLM